MGNDTNETTTKTNKKNDTSNEILTEFIKDCKWNEALTYLTNRITTTLNPHTENYPKKQELVLTPSTTTASSTTPSKPSAKSSSIILNALQKNAPIKLILKLINYYKHIIFKENSLLLHEICSNNMYYLSNECYLLHQTLISLDEHESLNENYIRATLLRDVDGQVPLHILIRRIFENSNITKLKQHIKIIEMYIKSCPKSCDVADYRDYEETPLILLLKVNTFQLYPHNQDNFIEIEQLVLRILKCMLSVNPNSGCTISHVFQYTPLHSALYHGRCYEIIQLIIDNYNYLYQQNKNKFQFISTRYETPLHFAAMRNENERIIKLLTNHENKYDFLNDMQFENDGLYLSPLYWLWIRFISNSFSVVNATTGNATLASTTSTSNTNADNNYESDDDNDDARHSFPFPFDGLSINDRKNYLNLDTQPQAQSNEDEIDIDYYNWIQTNDPSEDYRHMRFIPNHYNDINEPSAKFITRVLLQIQQKINNFKTATSFTTLQQLYEYYNLTDIEIKIILFWRKVLFYLHHSNTTGCYINAKGTNNKRQKIEKKSNNNILHTIATTRSCPISIFKIAFSLYPTSIQQQDSYNRLPLHYACMLYYNPTTSLFTNQQQQRQWYNNNSNNQYSILQQQHRQNSDTNEHDLNIINYIALKYPHGIKVHDVYFRLPIHYALENINNQNMHNHTDYNYIFYTTIMYNLISHFPTCLERRDGIFKLYPFMIVATSDVSSVNDKYALDSQKQQQQQRYKSNHCDYYYDAQVTICYELLRMSPNLVSTGIVE